MAGTLKGSVNHKIIAIDPFPTAVGQTIFVLLYRFLLQVATPVANNFGRLSLSPLIVATGMNMYDEISPVGNNAWAVFKFGNPGVYIYMHCTVGYSFPTGCNASNSSNDIPATPNTLCEGTGTGGTHDGIFMSVACRSDGGNPWAGTTNFNGADTKANPVWTNGGGGAKLGIIPMYNDWIDTNAISVSKEGNWIIADSPCFGTGDGFTSGAGLHMFADDNNLFFYFRGTSPQQGTAQNLVSSFYVGKFIQYPGADPYPFPYVVLFNALTNPLPMNYYSYNQVNFVYGGYDGTCNGAAQNQGMGGFILNPNTGHSSQIALDATNMFLDSYTQPSWRGKFGAATFHIGHSGPIETTYVGYLDPAWLLQGNRNLPEIGTSTDKTRAWFSNNLYEFKLIHPWSPSVSPPGFALNRKGEQFGGITPLSSLV